MTIENIFNFTCWNKQYLIVAERLRDNNLIHIQNIIPKSLILEAQWTLKELIKLIYNDDLESIYSIPIEKTLYNLAMQNRQKISYIYDAFKDSVIFSKICLCENLQLVAQYLLKHEVLSSPSNHWVFRVDLPEEQKYIFKWHYDLPYNMLGRRGLTFWIPLTNISLDMGPVVYSKLQEKELLPIELEQKNEKYSNAFIKNEYYDSLEDHAATSDIMEGAPRLIGSRGEAARPNPDSAVGTTVKICINRGARRRLFSVQCHYSPSFWYKPFSHCTTVCTSKIFCI